MAKEKSFSTMMGITKSVVPGIRVLNNFLSNYFGSIPKKNSEYYINKLRRFDFNDEILCKETSEEYDKLKNSFSEWIKSYLVYEYDTSASRDSIQSVSQWFPMVKGLIFEDSRATNLNDILFLMMYHKCEGNVAELYETHREKLERFFYADENGTGYNGFIQDTIKSIFKGFCHEKQNYDEIKEKRIEYLRQKLREPDVRKYLGYVTSLCIRFRKDFENIVENGWLLHRSIYTRIYYLQLFLNFYITLYTVRRTNYQKPYAYILCKGSPYFDCEEFDAACVQLYGSMRENVREKAEDFITAILKEDLEQKGITSRDNSLSLKLQEKGDVLCQVKGSEELLRNIVQDFKHIGKNNVGEFIEGLKALSNISADYKNVKYKDLARIISKSLLKRSAFIDSITQIFSNHGRRSGFVFPTGPSRYKFFAMSPELCSLLLRLYMQECDKAVDTVENFIEHLDKEYRVSLMQSDGIKSFMEQRNIKFPSNDDFTQNFHAFINTLSEINAVKKYSDTSYFVTLPGEAGRGEVIR